MISPTRRRQRCRRTMVGVAIAVVCVLAASSCGAGADSSGGDALPDMAFTTLDGQSIGLAEPGHQRVVNLWATWCAPCRRELPVFDEVAAELTSVEVIGVSVGDSREDAQELVDELGLSFPQILDPTAQLRTSQRITGMPATLFVSDGQVVGVHAGEVDRTELVELINQYFDAGLR